MDYLIENGVLIKVIDPEPSVIIPDSVRIIGSEAFLGCENITDIVIPKSVISIEKTAFACCNKIEKITIPDSVKNIDFYAFAWCKNLCEVKILAKEVKINNYAFANNIRLKHITIQSSISKGQGCLDGRKNTNETRKI